MEIKWLIPMSVVALLSLSLQASGRAIRDVDVRTIDRPWVHEDEFARDAALHATRDQTVVLHLESWDGRGTPIRKNALRFAVEQTLRFSFCIPEGEPHLLRIRLKRHAGPTLINGARGAACNPVTLGPGRYDLEVFHDARTVPAGGVKAFFHRPQKPRLLGGIEAAFGAPDFIAFRASNNKIVSGPDNQVTWQATADSVGPREVWRMEPQQIQGDPGTFYVLTNGNGFFVNNTHVKTDCDPDFTMYVVVQGDNDIEYCVFLPSPFLINDYGAGTFNLVLTSVTLDLEFYSGGIYTKTDGSDELFYNTQRHLSGETMTWEYKGYDCANGCDDSTLPLRTGEIALYAQCDFQGPAMVFSADRADLSLYDSAAAQGLAIGSNMLSSIRVGPDTLATLYDEAQFGGNLVRIGTDVACLDDLAFGENTASSFRIDGTFGYIVTTESCTECVLTGIDLSDYDFSNMDFTASIFDEATLTGTVFNAAILDRAHFSGAMLDGADFTAADLPCTQFDNTDLSGSVFANNAIARDFSCYLNVSGATLDYADFPVADWRYMNLTGSVMKRVPDTLSSLSAPLDLSGAILSGVQWLAGKTLDGVNLGCYGSQTGQTTVCPAPNGSAVCSTLQGTVLSGASLKRACLRSASMEGTFLSFSNLDSADLSDAELQAQPGGKVTTLEGAFMRNVNLSGANLTGVTADHVNFYTASGGRADATGVNAPGASFNSAYMAFADFSGAQSNLQSTSWTDAMLLGADFSQADLSTNTSGGINSGTNTTFEGAYLQGASFDQAVLDDVNFLDTYWDAFGAGGSLNLLIPDQNLQFVGYWKDDSLPECPQTLDWESGTPAPAGVTNSDNTCPNGLPGPCDAVWDQPKVDISLAFFRSAVPPQYPQDPDATVENQCSDSFSDPNPVDLCWSIVVEPPPAQCVANP